ncbi:glutamine-fructose-6-phosphate transaminase (isomerizing) [Edhazardia aedis USNM 41457]|uniref:glutamine--fructose-6-phosphate transaminase (isomerizing) n=1 Tax=Edhazardia aedis (strain USNM 41457) TaxID=1003232 RepID=J9D3U0_EDHAE|nr:glutamine-fructose-6-phosphate transaminase (isomerizing) [Edhazardia aedis USNM 41457]|eukprot:EJW02209.1 glutamine-fructose-6-phosphate transaminase (isomerizing) [Edhazardia aedis USNM 41457]
MCGIFGYANYGIERSKEEISDVLVNGLRRLEYRGYDSAGICVCKDDNKRYTVFRAVGKVQNLHQFVKKQSEVAVEKTVKRHVGIAHTRWATHGRPCEENSHPVSSDAERQFVVVHNGIISNNKDLRKFLKTKGYKFETETDTECAVKLALYFYRKAQRKGERINFIQLVSRVVKNCTGAYAFIFVSSHFPGEFVAVRRSSPLLIGVKSVEKYDTKCLEVDYCTDSEDEANCLLKLDDKEASEDVMLSLEKNDSSSNLECTPVNLYSPTSPTGIVKDSEQRLIDLNASIKSSNTSEEAVSGQDCEFFIASDPAAIVEHTRKVIFMEDDDMIHGKDGFLKVHRPNPKDTDACQSDIRKVDVLKTEIAQIMKGNFNHFMLKEIYEQVESVINTMRGRVDFENHKVCVGGIQNYIEKIQNSRRLVFVACGTSYHSCIATRALFEEMLNLPISVELASDFVDRQAPISSEDCVFFISQSGETADSLIALRYCLSKGALCVGITNTVGSSISRETTCGVHINAGPEIGVASTKAYSSQFIALILIALQLSQEKDEHQKRVIEIINGLRNLSEQIKKTLELDDQIKHFAYSHLSKDASLLLIGRGYQHATCLEGALKIKEVAYIHSEGILTGELKHGPLALIDEKVNVILLIMNDKLISKTQNAVQQISARSGKPFIICTKDIESEFKDSPKLAIPKTVDCLQGLLAVVPLQILSYHLAVARGYDVDCPRNLAKSVTVE